MASPTDKHGNRKPGAPGSGAGLHSLLARTQKPSTEGSSPAPGSQERLAPKKLARPAPRPQSPAACGNQGKASHDSPLPFCVKAGLACACAAPALSAAESVGMRLLGKSGEASMLLALAGLPFWAILPYQLLRKSRGAFFFNFLTACFCAASFAFSLRDPGCPLPAKLIEFLVCAACCASVAALRMPAALLWRRSP